MKYREFLREIVKQAIRNLSNNKFPCELSVQDIALETERILDLQGIAFSASSRSAQTSIGMFMSEMGHMSRRVQGQSKRWLILELDE